MYGTSKILSQQIRGYGADQFAVTVLIECADDLDLQDAREARRGCTGARISYLGTYTSQTNQKRQPKHTAWARPMVEPLQSMMEGHTGSLADWLRPF